MGTRVHSQEPPGRAEVAFSENRGLPDGDGLALTDELREASPGAALLVMSATVE
jgi:hypothetical protein